MRLTDEQVMKDNKRFANCNALAELKYCGWDIPHRKSITNDDIHFYAWLCRSAVAMLKEQQPMKPVYDCPLIKCPKCKNSIDGLQKYCDECGQAIDWSKDGEQE